MADNCQLVEIPPGNVSNNWPNISLPEYVNPAVLRTWLIATAFSYIGLGSWRIGRSVQGLRSPPFDSQPLLHVPDDD